MLVSNDNTYADANISIVGQYHINISLLYFLGGPRLLHECNGMLLMLYWSVVAGAILCAAACWGAGIKATDAITLKELIRKAGSVAGSQLEELLGQRLATKLLGVMDNPSHHIMIYRQISDNIQSMLILQ